ncbi:MAG: hypothetical protein NW241_10660 [Bacteroidia bacterium]|nr:hypothetical protein [Bacteroidia bacterium]
MAQEVPHQDGLDEYLTRAFEDYEGETPPDRVWEAIGRDLEAAAPAGAGGRVRTMRLRAGWLLPAAAAAAAALLVTGYLLLQAYERIESLSGQVADQGRRIEQMLAPAPEMPDSAGTDAALPGLPGAAAPAREQIAPAPHQRADREPGAAAGLPPLAPAAADALAAPAAPEARQILPPAAPLPGGRPALTALGPRRAGLPGSGDVLPAQAALPEQPFRGAGIALKVSASPQHLLPVMPPPSHGEWVAPQRVAQARDLRIGLGLRIRDRKRLSFEGGIYVQQRDEQTQHLPRLRYRREGGSGPEQQFRYRLYTSGDAQEVSVTLSRTAEPAPDSVQIPLTVETRQRSTSAALPLTARLSTGIGPLQVSVRAGAVVQYRLAGSLELLEVDTGSPYFRYDAEQQPALRSPLSSPALQMQYLAGAGAEWRLSPRLSLSVEPYAQFRPGSRDGRGGQHARPAHALAGIEAGLYCRF